MTRETKVGLLVGLGIILLVGIIVSDHLSVAQRQNAADFTGLTPSPNQTSGHGSQADPGTISRVGAAIRRITTPGANSSDPQHPQDADRSAAGLQTAGQSTAPLPLPADAQPTETPHRGYGPISPNPVPDGRDTDGRFAGNRGTPPVITFGAKPVVRSGQGASRQTKAETRAPARFVAPAASVVTYEPRETAPQPIVHYVKEGESLWQIAHRYYDNGEYWQTIARANPKAVMPSGGIRQGVRLVIPNKAGLVNAAAGSTGRAASLAPPSTATPTSPNQTTTHDPRVSKGVITVRGGDTLSALAQAHLGSGGRWRELYEANRDQLDQPHEVFVGMKLRLPAGHADQSTGNTLTTSQRGVPSRGGYVVKSNDSLSSIAAKTLGDAGRWEQIYKANKGRLDHPDDIRVGQKLVIPAR
jgi:nucleoid-associated protein YgaU